MNPENQEVGKKQKIMKKLQNLGKSKTI